MFTFIQLILHCNSRLVHPRCPVHNLSIVPDKLSSGSRTRMLEQSSFHHGVGGLAGSHGELSLLGDLAVVGPGVDAVHDNSIITF